MYYFHIRHKMDYKLRLLFVIFFPITTVADDRPITILRDLKLCFQNSGLPAFKQF